MAKIWAQANLFTGVGIATMCLAPRASARTSRPPEIVVRVNRPGAKIDPHMWGAFAEEITHGIDGGFYAEMVRNRNFADSIVPPGVIIRGNHMITPTGFRRGFPYAHDALPGWHVVKSPGSHATIILTRRSPMNAQQSASMALEIEKITPGGGWAGAVNGGYWGMNVRAGARYKLTVYARAQRRFTGRLRVQLRSKRAAGLGRALAGAVIGPLTNKWKAFHAVLPAHGSDPHAVLAILTRRAGTIQFGYVSLFPVKTWRNQPNGLRPALAGALAAMKPGFMRFPGGTFIEGIDMADAYNWEKTIGPNSMRPGRWDIWGYRSDDGMGMYEWLRFSQEMHAAPMLSVNAGLSMQEDQWHKSGHSRAARQSAYAPRGPALNHWVQIALAAIQYANGPATSKWGRLRAAAGHPGSFHLRYVEIGNEDGGATYNRHYAVFYHAIHRRYPHIRLIATAPVTSAPMPILDEHFYHGPAWFYQNFHHYDHYKRSGPKIFVGEYQASNGVGHGDLQGALSEAAFMCGMERNADVVRLASFGSLAANANAGWGDTMFYFGSKRVCKIPSYYVQKMFGTNRGNVVLPAHVLRNPQLRPALSRGGIALGGFKTQAQYRNIIVTSASGRVLYRSHFRDGLGGWRRVQGRWLARRGALQQTPNQRHANGHSLIVLRRRGWTNYTLRLQARKIAGGDGLVVRCRAANRRNWIQWTIGGWHNTQQALLARSAGARFNLQPNAAYHVKIGVWYRIKMIVTGRNVRCYLNDKLLDSARLPPTHQALYVSAVRQDAPAGQAATRRSRTVILKVVNSSQRPMRASLRLLGARGIEDAARALILTARHFSATNTLAHPHRVIMRNRPTELHGQRSVVIFPARSFTVLRINAGP